MTAGLSWTPQQREWLEALGHEVLGLAPTGPAQGDVAGIVAPVEGSMPVTRPAVGMPPRTPAPAVDARTAGTARAPIESALLRALAQAAGRAPDDGEFLRALPPLASLRGNPAARRALWPRLRALRRGARP